MFLKKFHALTGSLRGQLLLLLTIMVVPVLVVQMGVYGNWYRTQRAHEIQTNLEAARSLAVSFRAYAEDVTHQESAIGNAIVLSSLSGEVANRYLQDCKTRNPQIRSLMWLSPAGESLSATNPRLLGLHFEDRPYFQQVVAGKEWAISDLLISKATQEPTIAIAQRIMNQGQLAGVVVASFDPVRIGDLLGDVRPAGGVATLFDHSGILVSIRPRPAVDHRDWTDDAPALMNALMGKEQRGAFVSPIDQMYHYAAWAPIPDIGWVAGASRPVRVVTVPLYRSLFLATGLLTLSILLSVLFSLAIYRRIQNKMEQLLEYAHAIGQGDLTRQVEITGVAEFTQLGRGLGRMAEALRAAREEVVSHLAAIVTSSDDAILSKTLDGNILTWNKGAETMFGYSAAEVIGKPVSILVPPDRAGETKRIFDRILQGEHLKHFETVRMRKDGTLLHVALTISPIIDGNGNIMGVSTIGRDITERRRMEEERTAVLDALRESQASLAEAQRIAHMGSWDWNAATGELKWSDEVFRILGNEPQEFSPTYSLFLERVHPDDRSIVKDAVSRAWNDRKPLTVEHRVLLPSGGYRTVHEQGEVKCNGRDEPVRMLGTIVDITEHIEAEQEAKMRQQQLVQADKMVSLGILVSGVAHEINNPNHSIMTNVAILAEAWESISPILEQFYKEFGDFVVGGLDYAGSREQLPAMFSSVLASSKRIEVIVSELRDFARYSPKESMSAVDVNSVVKSATILVSNLIGKFTDRFRIHYAMRVPPVWGNFQRIEQVVINLIQNACHALPDRNREVYVGTSYDPEAQRVLVKVRDEGAGISERDLAHIGDPFFTTKRGMGGMGLGLWISFNIIHEHGGVLTFASEPGKGTTATISLPVDSRLQERMEAHEASVGA